MKPIVIAIALFSLSFSALAAQDFDVQVAIVSQALNERILERLEVSPEDKEAILEAQEEFKELKSTSTIEINLIKAQLARQLYYPDADVREVEQLLEDASKIRLEEEKAQLRTFLTVRQILGEETWEKLIRLIRSEARKRHETANQSGTNP